MTTTVIDRAVSHGVARCQTVVVVGTHVSTCGSKSHGRLQAIVAVIPPAGGQLVNVRLSGTARARPAEDASESVAKRRVVERVEERVDGRVGVAEPQSELVDAVVNRCGDEWLDDEDGEVGNPTDGKRHDH